MADDLSFTISAQDSASKAVETVQKKIQSFGSDVAKLALGVVGPMALLQAGIGYVTEKWHEYKQAQKDAFENGAAVTYNEVKAQEALGEQLDKNLSVLLAMAKVKIENAKNKEDITAQEDQAIEEFKKTQAYLKFTDKLVKTRGGVLNELYTREEVIQAAKAEGARINKEMAGKVNGPFITPEERARIDEQNKIEEEDKKRRASGAYQNEQINSFLKRFIDESTMPKQAKTKEETKDDLKLTVSSLGEIGGSFGGGDVSTGIEKQIVLAEKQLDTLTEIKDALNRGSQESQVFPQGLREAMETTA
jgi:hypothetical protein